jgi:hypothetical protein
MKQSKRAATGGARPNEPRPKKTRQGDGLRSRPSHGRKKSRGQGR